MVFCFLVLRAARSAGGAARLGLQISVNLLYAVSQLQAALRFKLLDRDSFSLAPRVVSGHSRGRPPGPLFISKMRGHLGVPIAKEPMSCYTGAEYLVYGCTSHTWSCISYIGVHLIYICDLIHGCASYTWLCISNIGVHLIHGCASHIWACISYIVVHLRHGRASQV
jgi:hypothetical protein